MDYHEFMEKAKTKVTTEEYERIEFVYLNGPHNIIGGFVTAFCEWYNANGGMKAIDAMYPYVEATWKKNEIVKEYKAQIEDLKKKQDLLSKEIEVYRSMVSEDDLLEQIDKRATRENLIRFITELGE